MNLASSQRIARVYEIILGEQLDKRSFRKWVLALEQIEETGKEKREGDHRPAMLYPHKTSGESGNYQIERS